MVTIHSQDLKTIDEPCFAAIGHRNGCRVLMRTHDNCGTYKCPFYKPKDCKEWVRIDDKNGVSLIPPEDLGGKKDEQNIQK